jgi:hypothetical protein
MNPIPHASGAARRRPDLAAQLRDLAQRVARLCPSHRNPEEFHEAKSEIEDELRRLSQAASGRGGRP